jgi:hypothetical protein
VIFHSFEGGVRTYRKEVGRPFAVGGRRLAARLVVLLMVLGAIAAASPLSAAAQAAVLGRVSEAAGPLVGATVTLEGAAVSREARTGDGGDYEIAGLPPGRYRLTAELVGYTPVAREVQVSAGERARVDFRLSAATVLIEGLTVEGTADRDRERLRFATEPGVTARIVGGETLKTLPGLAEADVLRAVELLPGVVSTSDFSSAFNVRGGSADQNLILLDGFPVFNPFHLGGLFSVFNSDAIARAELFAGGFGAEYGGRVSSVLNIETAGAADSVEVVGGVSVLAARALVRTPLPARLVRAVGGERGSLMLSARRSYFDQILRPVIDFPYHLTDLQGYGEVWLRGGGRVSVTGYAGADVWICRTSRRPAIPTIPASCDCAGTGATVCWASDGSSRWPDSGSPRRGSGTRRSRIGWASSISPASSSAAPSRRPRSGRNWCVTSVPPGSPSGGSLDRMSYENFARAGGTEFFGSADQGVAGAAFASSLWRIGDTWLLEPGLRMDVWAGSDGAHPLLSPRFAVKRFLGPDRDAAAKLTVGRYTQFLHSLRNEDLPVSNDTWVLTGNGVPAVVSDQVQVGIEKFFGEQWHASAEAYWRGFQGTTEFNIADDPNDPADDLLSGDGRSYGLDLFLRRRAGRLTGWTSLSFLQARRTIPDPLAAGFQDLPPDVTFAPIFDRTVDLDLVLQYELPGRWDVGARWNFGSPIPYTRPVSQYYAFRYSPLQAQFEPDLGGGRSSLYVALGGRNAERYPPYHRLDVTVRRTFRPRWGTITPYLQVLNLYNRRNVLWYFYNYERVPATRSGVSMFPVVPAIGMEFSF